MEFWTVFWWSKVEVEHFSLKLITLGGEWLIGSCSHLKRQAVYRLRDVTEHVPFFAADLSLNRASPVDARLRSGFYGRPI
jgi:hypothetical protein